MTNKFIENMLNIITTSEMQITTTGRYLSLSLGCYYLKKKKNKQRQTENKYWYIVSWLIFQ